MMKPEIHLYFKKTQNGVVPDCDLTLGISKQNNWISKNKTIKKEVMDLIIESNPSNVIFHIGEDVIRGSLVK